MTDGRDFAEHAHIIRSVRKRSTLWDGSPWRGLLELSAPEAGRAFEMMFAEWMRAHGFEIERALRADGCDFIVGGALRIELKGARRSAYPPNKPRFRYRPIIDEAFHALVMVGVEPGPEGEHHIWVTRKRELWNAPTCVSAGRDGQRQVCIQPEAPPDWLRNPSGSPAEAVKALRVLLREVSGPKIADASG